jgi:signal transduction histidine kinase
MTPRTRSLSQVAAARLAAGPDLGQVVREFPAVLERLRSAYAELQARAERVEGELAQANRELAEKVRELDRLLRERTEMDARLHAADKMAALGTLAAGIAHEIRNPLNAVRGFAALLLRRPELDPRFHRWCQLILDGASEADEIIENMLSFGSPERLRLEAIRPDELLEDARRAALLSGGAGVPVELVTQAAPFLGDRIKLRQAIRNLIANALVVQPHGGRVRVELAQVAGDVQVRVLDAGPGVPAAIQARIFDPFYTTRPEGTGLGLALVAVIARLHGGEAALSPRPSHLGGAEFLLRIPFHPADLPAAIPLSQD